jgi:hypothetical protein
MTLPCPCRGCLAAYKAGAEDMREAALDTFIDDRTDVNGAKIIREHHVLDAYTSLGLR